MLGKYQVIIGDSLKSYGPPSNSFSMLMHLLWHLLILVKNPAFPLIYHHTMVFLAFSDPFSRGQIISVSKWFLRQATV